MMVLLALAFVAAFIQPRSLHGLKESANCAERIRKRCCPSGPRAAACTLRITICLKMARLITGPPQFGNSPGFRCPAPCRAQHNAEDFHARDGAELYRSLRVGKFH